MATAMHRIRNLEVVITRDVRYEIRIPFDVYAATPAVELRDMTIVNDSGPQTFIVEEKQEEQS